jgi:membrane protein DedA with SNARE-associated domain
MMAAGFGGIVVGDSLIFFAGRRVGRARVVQSGFLARMITPEKRAKVEALFARHGEKIVLVARFLPGVRAVTFFTAGSAGMSYARFVLFDATAALASAPLFVYVGFRFGNRIHQVVERVKEGQLSVIFTLLALGLLSWLWKRVRRARAAAAAVKAPARSRLP